MNYTIVLIAYMAASLFMGASLALTFTKTLVGKAVKSYIVGLNKDALGPETYQAKESTAMYVAWRIQCLIERRLFWVFVVLIFVGLLSIALAVVLLH